MDRPDQTWLSYVLESDSVYAFCSTIQEREQERVVCYSQVDVEVEDKSRVGWIAIATSPNDQRKGYGSKHLTEIVSRIDSACDRLVASICDRNEASIRFFENAGFTLFKRDSDEQSFAYYSKDL